MLSPQILEAERSRVRAFGTKTQIVARYVFLKRQTLKGSRTRIKESVRGEADDSEVQRTSSLSNSGIVNCHSCFEV